MDVIAALALTVIAVFGIAAAYFGGLILGSGSSRDERRVGLTVAVLGGLIAVAAWGALMAMALHSPVP